MSVGFPDNVEEMLEKIKTAWEFQVHTGKRKNEPFPEHLLPTEQYIMTYGRYPVAYNWRNLLNQADRQYRAQFPVNARRTYHFTFSTGKKGVLNYQVNHTSLNAALDRAYELLSQDINESKNLIKWKITNAVYLLEIH
ncbi:MAG: hypothetical protein WC967_09315 [Balneolaceae bacterium]